MASLSNQCYGAHRKGSRKQKDHPAELEPCPAPVGGVAKSVLTKLNVALNDKFFSELCITTKRKVVPLQVVKLNKTIVHPGGYSETYTTKICSCS